MPVQSIQKIWTELNPGGKMEKTEKKIPGMQIDAKGKVVLQTL